MCSLTLLAKALSLIAAGTDFRLTNLRSQPKEVLLKSWRHISSISDLG